MSPTRSVFLRNEPFRYPQLDSCWSDETDLHSSSCVSPCFLRRLAHAARSFTRRRPDDRGMLRRVSRFNILRILLTFMRLNQPSRVRSRWREREFRDENFGGCADWREGFPTITSFTAQLERIAGEALACFNSLKTNCLESCESLCCCFAC